MWITLLNRSFLFFVHFKHRVSNAGQFARDTMDLSGCWALFTFFVHMRKNKLLPSGDCCCDEALHK